MEPYVKRMIEESEQLNERIGKLRKFIEASEYYSMLPYTKQFLMWRQLRLMIRYERILRKRINLEDTRE